MSTAQAKPNRVSDLWVVPRELTPERRPVAAVNKSLVFTLGEVGTGIHRFPVKDAAEVAVRTVLAELAAEATPTVVRFVLFAPAILNAYVEAAVVALRALPVRDKSTSIFNLRRSP